MTRESEMRERVCASIRADPGRSIREIATGLGVSHGTVSYHAERLVRVKLVAQTKDGNKVRLFAHTHGLNADEQAVLAALSNAETRRILSVILNHPGSYRTELRHFARVSAPTLSWHLRRLLGTRLVTEKRYSNRLRYLESDRPTLERTFAALRAKLHGTAFDARPLFEVLQQPADAPTTTTLTA